MSTATMTATAICDRCGAAVLGPVSVCEISTLDDGGPSFARVLLCRDCVDLVVRHLLAGRTGSRRPKTVDSGQGLEGRPRGGPLKGGTGDAPHERDRSGPFASLARHHDAAPPIRLKRRRTP
jgi:hypothetical protein